MIYISVGHSQLKNGYTTGADGYVNEYFFCKSIAKKLKNKLEKNKIEADIIICPEKKFQQAADERLYKINMEHSKKYDYGIELHLNASNNKNACGCECLYVSSSGKNLADNFQNELTKILHDRGIKKRTDLYMLNRTYCPFVIIELFFATNKMESETPKKIIVEKLLDAIVKIQKIQK